MDEEMNWEASALSYDENKALLESKITWLRLGRMFNDVAIGFSDFLESPKSADEAMAWAARGEACLWRATGGCDAMDADKFILAKGQPDAQP